MKFTFTDEQLLAQNSIDNHISLSANAGSGKTSVLTERLLNILREKDKDANSQVAAITFTKKAASEMMERLVNKVDERYYDAFEASNSDDIALYQRIRRKLSSSKIMTIHSFCVNILRDYTVNAGLDPNFTELDDVQKHFIYKDALYDTFDEIINRGEEKPEYTDALLTIYKPKELKEILLGILNKPDIYEDLRQLYSKSEEEYVNYLSGNYFLIIQPLIEEFKNTISVGTGLVKNWKNDNKDIAEKLINNILNSDIPNYQDILNLCNIRHSGKLFFIRSIHPDKKAFEDKITAAITPATNASALHLQYNFAKILIGIATSVKEKIQTYKKKLGCIDFDDMLHITRKLLVDNPDIAQSIASQFTEIMVDEFQDTNNTQFDIIKSLVPSVANPDAAKTTNLFIVGDEKQSIYRFRSADVAVFIDAKERIKQVNPNGELRLSATFRSLPLITAFINKVCGTLFNAIKEQSKIEYSNLICGRDSGKYNDYFASQSTDEPPLGSINFLLTLTKKKDEQENDNEDENLEVEEEKNTKEDIDDTMLEASLVAQHIQYIVANYKKENGENYKYSDIAVLFRSRTKLTNLTLALIKAEVKYSVSNGKNFYNKPEIHDLTAFLTFLNNPKDDLALLTMMLSPYYNLDKADILNISCQPRGTIWDKLGSYCKTADATDGIKKMKADLEHLLHIAQEVSITHLLRLILKDGAWLLYPLESQANKNIEKFLSIAREFQSRNFVTLSDFVDDLSVLADISDEGEAADNTTENAVSLLTIHSAKGLEFPVVILYNLNSPKKNNNKFTLNKKYGIGLKTPENIDELEKIDTIANFLINKEEEQLEYAETLRLLYVAMSRAENHLVLSANLKETTTGIGKLGYYFGLITETIGLDTNILQRAVNADKYVFNIDCNVHILNGNAEGVPYTINSNIITKYPALPTAMDRVTDTTASPIAPIVKHCDTEFTQADRTFSFSSLSKHSVVRAFDNSANTDTITGATKGSIYHKVLEKINFWFDGTISQKMLSNVIDDAVQNIIGDIDYVQKQYIDDFTAITNTQLLQQYKGHLKDAIFEMEANIPIGKNFFIGIIDCLVPDGNGNYEIWDWKSNRVNNETQFAELKNYYSQQMRMYLYLLMHLFPEQQRYTARLLFTTLAKNDATNDDWTYTVSANGNEKQKLFNEIQEQINQNAFCIRSDANA
ncbi:MAG: UvrD-helicase domain-containing protein [Ignavibacteria bacterium]|jgi:ATP-dependent helicase/nuclease subunit A|nr:UvrD-helicase domain-containing protein [Ignavibacteria bacterium]